MTTYGPIQLKALDGLRSQLTSINWRADGLLKRKKRLRGNPDKNDELAQVDSELDRLYKQAASVQAAINMIVSNPL